MHTVSTVVKFAVTALLASASVAAIAEPPARVVFEDVVVAYRSGQREEALKKMQQLAQAGDARAQLLLGIHAFEQPRSPAERSQGYAWLLIASKGYVGSYGSSARKEAEQIMAKVEPALSGRELIAADQIANEFLDARRRETDANIEAAMAALNGGESASGKTAVVGCGRDPELSGCPAELKAAKPSCKGEPVRPEVEASVSGEGARIREPRYPVLARKLAVEGAVVYLAHVDQTGYVCQVAIVQGSGLDDIDRAVVNAVRTWRLRPALKAGAPVESVKIGAVQLGLTDYSFQQN